MLGRCRAVLVRAELLDGPALVDEHVVACLDFSGHEWLEIADVLIQRRRPSSVADFFARFPGCSLLLTTGAVFFRDGRCVPIHDDAEWILASVLYFWDVMAGVPSARVPGDVRLTIHPCCYGAPAWSSLARTCAACGASTCMNRLKACSRWSRA